MLSRFTTPRRVVITGMGCVTPIGIGREAFWSGLQNGEILEFRVPDPDVVYLCETDRLAALDNGKVVRLDTGDSAGRYGANSADA